MIYEPHYLTEEEVCAGAYSLFTSSSLSRYVQMAESLPGQSRLRARIVRGELAIEDAVRQARYLWASLVKSKQRDIGEVEVVAILGVVKANSSKIVDDLLTFFSTYDRSPVNWISAYARHLHLSRPENQSIDLRLKGQRAYFSNIDFRQKGGRDKFVVRTTSLSFRSGSLELHRVDNKTRKLYA